MSYESRAPYAPQDTQEVAQVVRGLEQGTKKGADRKGMYRCKKTTFAVDGTQGLSIDSWKFMDWDYKRDDLPIYARGLFTYQGKGGAPEICIRGYNKFFNTEEVNDTRWRHIENFTKGPYELSVKENGCIIFMSGLPDDKLLVCSKHATGVRTDVELSHASAGEQWIEKHLATVGKTKEQLARRLREMNATAVGELCDDSFEEHVLAYGPDSAGLYLHGINLNIADFATWSGPKVDHFADEWGFRKVKYVVKDDIKDVKKFLDACAETGSWDDRETEGFVVRCQKKVPHTRDEYEDWFFKYKFEEPYLMYRQWRECTKALIAGKEPKYKKHPKITREYLSFAKQRLVNTPGLGKAYSQNHGIIKMRDDFLEHRGAKGSDLAREGFEDGQAIARDVVLVPVATIGCGKTTVALALVKLFGWGHIQNDNITGTKGRPTMFANKIKKSLAEHPVVIADRNNHQRRERKQIIDDVGKAVLDARFVALHYVHDPKSQMLPAIREVTRERVLERGDNHQTIRAGSKSQDKILEIMEGFLDRFEPVDVDSDPDVDFDEVIHLDVTEDSRHNLQLVVDALHEKYPALVPDLPSSAELDRAIEAAINEYSVDLKHDLNFQSKKKGREKENKHGRGLPMREPLDREPEDTTQQGSTSPSSMSQTSSVRPRNANKIEYFGVQLDTSQILSAVEAAFAKADAATARFYRQLQASRRVQPRFHVTLIHRSAMAQHSGYWSRLVALYQSADKEQGSDPNDPLLGRTQVLLERVIWDGRVMAIVARLQDPEWECVNAVAHVTVGTASSNIKPKESNDMLFRWTHEGAVGENGLMELQFEPRVEAQGEVRAVTPSTR